MNIQDKQAVAWALEAHDLYVVRGGRNVVQSSDLAISPGETLVVIGPNGSGKSSLLLALALLIDSYRGTIRHMGRADRESTRLEMRRRSAVVFQDPLLLSTSVLENVSLGLRLRGRPSGTSRDLARFWLRRFGIEHLESRNARLLSGGEAQRVSLARAFVVSPELLFLDEPFSSLDQPSRQSLIEDLRLVIKETHTTTVMVTHSRDEALALGDRVAVLINGRIRQTGTPESVFSAPADEEVAAFVGIENVLAGTVTESRDGMASVVIAGGRVEAVSGFAPGSAVTVCLRPEDVTLSLAGVVAPVSSARNRLPARISAVTGLGSQVKLTLDCGFPLVSLITRRSFEEMSLDVSSAVIASFKASSVHLLRRS
ncbi:MAG: ABC transporter ATP-binding protein [Chloroflexi bacterium]|nr:ABC transporter ATP-binding protein [Chloroflexota bacterium]